MAKTDSLMFWTVFLIIFFINIFTPTIASGFGESYGERNPDTADPQSPPSTSDILNFTILNIFLVPFWTLSLPTLLNVIFMIPLRVLAWYLVLRMIRGN